MKYRAMMNDIQLADKMFGVVMSNKNGQFCEVGTAVENIKRGMHVYRYLDFLIF